MLSRTADVLGLAEPSPTLFMMLCDHLTHHMAVWWPLNAPSHWHDRPAKTGWNECPDVRYRYKVQRVWLYDAHFCCLGLLYRGIPTLQALQSWPSGASVCPKPACLRNAHVSRTCLARAWQLQRLSVSIQQLPYKVSAFPQWHFTAMAKKSRTTVQWQLQAEGACDLQFA